MCPNNASYYGNRAATLMMLGRFREALGDAQQSVRLDDSFVRVCNGALWWRMFYSISALELLTIRSISSFHCDSHNHLLIVTMSPQDQVLPLRALFCLFTACWCVDCFFGFLVFLGGCFFCCCFVFCFSRQSFSV
jgi:hypothetical protein